MFDSLSFLKFSVYEDPHLAIRVVNNPPVTSPPYFPTRSPPPRISTPSSQNPSVEGFNYEQFFSPTLPVPFQEVSPYNLSFIRRPYLSLSDRLSQVWLNQYTLTIVLVVIKLVMFRNRLNGSLENLSNYTKTACSTIETYSSEVSSVVPHYASLMGNKLVTKSVEELTDATIKSLLMTITIAEALVVFTIESVIGTYTCILTAAIDGSVGAAVNATESVINIANTTVVDIADGIQHGLEDVSKVVNKILSGVGKLETLFSSGDVDPSDSIKKVDLSVASLKNWKLPDSINGKLTQLQTNLPNFTAVEDYTKGLIQTPFEGLKKEINGSMASLRSKMLNESLLVLPVSRKVDANFCVNQSSKVDEFYAKLGIKVRYTSNIVLGLLIAVAVLVLIPLIVDEIFRWRRINSVAEDLMFPAPGGSKSYYGSSLMGGTEVKRGKLSWLEKGSRFIPQGPASNLNTPYPVVMEILGNSENRLSYYLTRVILRVTPTRVVSSYKIPIKWFIAYVSSSRSLTVLFVALMGLIAVLLQYILLSLVASEVPRITEQAEDLVHGLFETMDIKHLLDQWTNGTNQYIGNQEAYINENMLGWVNQSTTSVNHTVDEFIQTMNTAIDDVFRDTPLYSAVTSVVYCVVGRKLESVEKGLVWVQDNVHVTLPRVNEDLLYNVVNAASSNTGASKNTNSGTPSSYGFNRTASGDLTEIADSATAELKRALNVTITEYNKGLRFELSVSLAIMGVWSSQVFVGVLILVGRITVERRRNRLDEKLS